MVIKCFKMNFKWISVSILSILLICIFIFSNYIFSAVLTSNTSEKYIYNNEPSTSNDSENTEKDYIKWFEFNVSYEVLDKTSKLDINSHQKNEEIKYNWIELISYLACKYGNNFSKFKQADLDKLVAELKNGKTIEELTEKMKLYPYYYECYDAVLHEFIGEYKLENKKSSTNGSTSSLNTETNIEEKQYDDKYGIKAFSPIAKNYGYSHYDDFGASRSYGYKRLHFGNDLMGSIGTPIIAVESGVVEALGWNQYGGWRIGIRSFDKKRYYYYAHLRKNHPYAENLKEGQIVKAGDVIGYLGMTGYSTKENVNNINVPHLHFGIQLIFDEVQKEGPNQIWVDLYDLVDFLKKNCSEVYKSNTETKDYSRKYDIIDPSVPD